MLQRLRNDCPAAYILHDGGGPSLLRGQRRAALAWRGVCCAAGRDGMASQPNRAVSPALKAFRDLHK